ncbi:MAG TPA: alanine--glyoxylate aminotransferase family protein [Trueperaceae bacterium]
MKERLLAPGPVAVPPPVLEAMAQPVFMHRGERFRSLLLRVRERLAELACVPGEEVLVITGSGTAAFEAVLLATVPAGSKIVSVQAGKFGERWGQMAERFGYLVVPLRFPWGRAADPEVLARELERHPDAAAVTTTHSETSTGVLHDVEALAITVRRAAPDALVLVDAVTSLAASELRPLDWGLDAIVSGSQKGLMTPPGLGVAWLSERAWRSGERSRPPSYYLDLHKERRSQARGETAYTPAVNLVAGLDAALGMLLDEGVEQVWSRRTRLNEAVLAGGEAIGLIPYAQRVSPAVAALAVPTGIAAPDVVAALRHRGITISGGQDEAKPVLLRPSVLGWADEFDAITIVAALEQALRELGRQVPPGAGVGAAMRVLEAA